MSLPARSRLGSVVLNMVKALNEAPEYSRTFSHRLTKNKSAICPLFSLFTKQLRPKAQGTRRKVHDRNLRMKEFLRINALAGEYRAMIELSGNSSRPSLLMK